MKRRLALTVVAILSVGFVGLLVGDASVEAGKDGAGGKTYELVAPLDVIMEYGDEIFYEMPDRLKKNKFKALHKDALFLAELSNIYSYAKEYREKEGWAKMTEKAKSELMKLAQAAKDEDGAKVKSLHSAVEETCDSCHEEFRD